MRYFVCTNTSGNDSLYKSMKQFELLEDVLLTMMFKICILYCALPVILGGPFTGQQHEPNHITNTASEFNVLTPKELAEKAGYIAETHRVVTEDRYILQLDRIVGSDKIPPSDDKIAVLFVHGVFDCSASWLLSGPEKSLGFILADWGYDVWLGNVRGNRYSQNHLDWTVSEPDFWMFSWHEIGVYDLPAMIDHILTQTKKEKIFIISHSQGGTSFFVMASERPEYQEKIIASFALGPAVFMSRTKSPLFHVLAPFSNDINFITDLIGMYEFKPSDKLIQMLGTIVCDKEALLQPICKNIVFLCAGFSKELNTTLLPVIVQYDPAGSSVRQIVHYGQLISSGKFRKFDYGLVGNMKRYGTIHPPDYNLANVKLPVYLHYSASDMYTDVQDLHQLYRALPNAQKLLVPSDSFGHIDFLWGKHVDAWVYNEILSLMETHKK
ncbi:lipase 3-like [Bombus huntii]|uniref:lipase 3-like n=1 Tax=Bombus huntii TaxID=85661 RepID=UPI0021AA680C|nr:lipase 3-like [Bombus huntii]